MVHRRKFGDQCLSWVIRVDFGRAGVGPLFPDSDQRADILGRLLSANRRHHYRRGGSEA
jgi:hypothetical protein